MSGVQKQKMYDIWKEDLDMPTVKHLVESAAKEEKERKKNMTYQSKIK